MRALALGLAHIALTGASAKDDADEVPSERVEHKPSKPSKRQARRERKALKVARTCGRHT